MSDVAARSIASGIYWGLVMVAISLYVASFNIDFDVICKVENACVVESEK